MAARCATPPGSLRSLVSTEKMICLRLCILIIAVLTLNSQVAWAQQCSDTTFVQRVYQDLLLRQPSASEVTFYVPAVQSNGRQAVASSLLASQEYALDVISGAYRRMLRRPAMQGEINSFLSPLKSDARSDEDLLAILAGSSEYCSSTVQPPPAFQLQAPATTFPALNSVTIPSNLSLLPAVQFGPLEASSNADILGLQVVVSSDEARITSLNAEVSRLNDQITLLNSLLLNEPLSSTDLTNTFVVEPRK